MNNAIVGSRIRTAGSRLTVCVFLFGLLVAVGGCQPASQNGASREEAPVEATTGDVRDEDVSLPEDSPAVIAGGAAAVSAADTGGTETRTDDVVPSRGAFCLRLASARDHVLLGEPLTLMVVLQNCSQETLQVRDLLGPEYGLLSIRIAHPKNDEEQFYSPLVRRDGRGKGYVDLDTGDILAAAIPVYFGRDGWQVDSPGLYSFRAEYSFDDISLTSNTVSVNVANPPNEAESMAAKSFMGADASTFYFLGGGNDNGRDELHALAADQPNSLWADYANLGLAIDLANDRNSPSRAEACRTLEASLNEIESDWIIALRGFEILSKCLQESGLESEVSRVTDAYFGRHPGAQEVLGRSVQ